MVLLSERVVVVAIFVFSDGARSNLRMRHPDIIARYHIWSICGGLLSILPLA